MGSSIPQKVASPKAGFSKGWVLIKPLTRGPYNSIHFLQILCEPSHCWKSKTPNPKNPNKNTFLGGFIYNRGGAYLLIGGADYPAEYPGVARQSIPPSVLPDELERLASIRQWIPPVSRQLLYVPPGAQLGLHFMLVPSCSECALRLGKGDAFALLWAWLLLTEPMFEFSRSARKQVELDTQTGG